MSPLDPTVRELVDELANALQSVVLIAEQLERESTTVAADSHEVTIRLHRATTALRAIQDARDGKTE